MGGSYYLPYEEMLVRADNPSHAGAVGVSDFVTGKFWVGGVSAGGG